MDVLAGDHIQQDGGDVLRPHLAALVLLGEVYRAEEVVVGAGIEDKFLAVEEHEIDSDLGGQVPHVPAQLHEQGNAGAAVVGTDEWLVPIPRVVLLVGDGAGVVVRAEDDPPLAGGVPGDDQVGHLGRLAAADLAEGELLVLNLGAQILEVLLDQLLLFPHPFRAADTGADRADRFEVAHGPLGIEGDVPGNAMHLNAVKLVYIQRRGSLFSAASRCQINPLDLLHTPFPLGLAPPLKLDGISGDIIF